MPPLKPPSLKPRRRPIQHSRQDNQNEIDFLQLIVTQNSHLESLAESINSLAESTKALGERMVRVEVLMTEALRRIEGVEKNLSTFVTHKDLQAIRESFEARSVENDSRLSRIEADLTKLLEERVASSRILVIFTTAAAALGGLTSWAFNQLFSAISQGPKP